MSVYETDTFSEYFLSIFIFFLYSLYFDLSVPIKIPPDPPSDVPLVECHLSARKCRPLDHVQPLDWVSPSVWCFPLSKSLATSTALPKEANSGANGSTCDFVIFLGTSQKNHFGPCSEALPQYYGRDGPEIAPLPPQEEESRRSK